MLYDGADDIVSQNLGAKQYDRAKKGARFGILCSIIIAELIGAVIYTAAPTLIAAFNSDPEVVHYWCDAGENDCTVLLPAGVFSLYRGRTPRFRKRIDPDARHALCLVPVPRQLHYRDGPADPGYPRDFLGLPADLEHQSAFSCILFLRGKWVYGFEKGGKR